MYLSTFTNTFADRKLESVLRKLVSLGIRRVQLNLLSCSMDLVPSCRDERAIEQIALLGKDYGVEFISLAGTCNLIDPDESRRRANWDDFEVLCSIAETLGIPIVTLCTGSKNPKSRWEWHDDNSTQKAWRDLEESTEHILRSAQKHSVVLGVEPERSNVVRTPELARRYLDEFDTPLLKIVMDGSNLFYSSNTGCIRSVLDNAFDLLGGDIIQAHAKDFCIGSDGNTIFVPAGTGLLDYGHYFSLLRKAGFDGDILLHGLSETELPGCLAFIAEVDERV